MFSPVPPQSRSGLSILYGVASGIFPVLVITVSIAFKGWRSLPWTTLLWLDWVILYVVPSMGTCMEELSAQAQSNEQPWDRLHEQLGKGYPVMEQKDQGSVFRRLYQSAECKGQE